MPDEEINVGLFVAHSPGADAGPLERFLLRLRDDVAPDLQSVTGVPWHFHIEEPTRLSSDDPRRPADFLDEATLRMAEGPYDAVVVLSDVGLVSRRHRVVAGLVSVVSRVAVISTRRLLLTPRGRSLRSLEDESVRWNAAALLLHLLGHVLDLPHRRDPDDAMSRFVFREDRQDLPRFTDAQRLGAAARRLPAREHRTGSWWGTLLFHLAMAARHPAKVFWPVLRNRAPLLPLALPGLATAAVAPTLVLLFTAEIWDAGLTMAAPVTWTYAGLSILAATIYLVSVQNLFLPSKEKRLINEHLAVVNVSIFVSMLFAVLGLFIMVGLLMLGLETLVFPQGLMATWPTLQQPEVTLEDKIRLAAFISTVGVTTGALAGGLESRAVIRHLALFLDEP